MTSTLRRLLPAVLAVATIGAHAQFYKLHGGSLSVGATGDFPKELSTNSTAVSVTGNTVTTTAVNQQQFTTNSVGFLTSLQLHPVAWAGVELNYGFTHYSERYSFNYANNPATVNTVSIPVDRHETTAAYIFHPKRIPFQPFVGIGGGAIDFAPTNASNQWRGAGLLEAAFDIPVKYNRIGFRLGARSLYYREPNFYTPSISTRAWRVSAQPTASVFYRF